MELTREQVREMDRKAIEEYGIQGIILMENAGIAVANEVWRTVNAKPSAKVVVLSGKGNNGGDGYVATRHLFNRGLNPVAFVFASFDEIRGDAAANLAIIRKMGINTREIKNESDMPAVEDALKQADVIVDALLGTGLAGEVRGLPRAAIELINDAGGAVVSVDIASGLDANSGHILGACVDADVTVTFVAAKTGFSRGAGPQQTGRVSVAEISIPRQVVEAACRLTKVAQASRL